MNPKRYAKRRSDFGAHEGKPTFDLINVCPDGIGFPGVRHLSYLGISNMTTCTAKLRLWIPGIEGIRSEVIEHGVTFPLPIPAYGTISVVVDELTRGDKVIEPTDEILGDLHVYHELFPYKA